MHVWSRGSDSLHRDGRRMPVGSSGPVRGARRNDAGTARAGTGSPACGSRRQRRVRRHRRAERRVVRHASGPDPRPDRTERRRQDHAVQLPQPALSAERRRHPDGGREHPDAARRTGSPKSASAAPSRTSRCSPICRCSTMSGSAPIPAPAATSSATRCKLPWVRRTEAAAQRARPRDPGLSRPRRRRPHHRRRPAVRHPEARRTGPRARRRSEDPAARRARRRPQP